MDGKVSDVYQAKAIPEIVVIGKDGVIVSVHVGLMEDVKKELGRELEAAQKKHRKHGTHGKF